MQDTHLFSGIIKDNIRYGKLDATDKEVEAAAKLANADFFIRQLPQGYDTELTGDGCFNEGTHRICDCSSSFHH